MRKPSKSQLEAAIKEYLRKGWDIDIFQFEGGGHQYNVVGPQGRYWDSEYLTPIDCAICCDDEDAICVHEEETLKEQEEARSLYELVRLYTMIFSSDLPTIEK